MKNRIERRSCFQGTPALALALAIFLGAASAFAQPWSFGVMADTQWHLPDDGKNFNSVAVDFIQQINQEFITHGVKFVIQVGDLADLCTTAGLNTRAQAAEDLYRAGIGFYPLRGNHDNSYAAALQFQTLFPQTQGVGSNVSGATHFSSPFSALAGLSYSFDYNNARFVLLDQFARADGTGGTAAEIAASIADQQFWIGSTLAGKPAGGHAFVFSHKNLIGENHTETLFGSDPSQNTAAQNAFINSLSANSVRYHISGHDHIHQRSIIRSPDGASEVEQIISGSVSSKFYVPMGNGELPGTLNNDVKYNAPPRETSISQERNSIGYYVYTVDGPCVTVNYYSARVYPGLDVPPSGHLLISASGTLNFMRQESFGYCLNGKEFMVEQGQSYAAIEDSFSDTTVQILNGINGSTAADGSGRRLTHAVGTGWSPRTRSTASDILTLWGMANSLGSDQTDVYTLSMNYNLEDVSRTKLRRGSFGLATLDASGRWINAVDMNFSGSKKYVVGSWDPSYKLGTYGVDPSTHTAWAVINYNSTFAVAPFRQH